jgi:tetratricopeptide (TPR) repeat protein
LGQKLSARRLSQFRFSTITITINCAVLNRIVYACCLIFLVFALESCVTTRSRNKDLSPIGKLYHNTTALYNGYFNANEIMEATYLELEQQHRDNYGKILPVFPYTEISNPQQAAAKLDEAVKKVTKVAAIHPKSHWVDDCYLLAGKAHFLKQDYETAETTLRWLVNEYNPEREKLKKAVKKGTIKKGQVDTKSEEFRALSLKQKNKIRARIAKEKKKQAKKLAEVRKKYNKDVAEARKKGKPLPPKPEILNKPKAGDLGAKKDENKTPEAEAKEDEKDKKDDPSNDKFFMKHRPCYQEGMLWLARTMMERDNHDAAMRYIAELESSPTTFASIRGDMAPILANYYIERKQYDNALEPIKQAVETAETRKQRMRYTYILGQLQQKAGNWADAYYAYEEVSGYNGNFDLAFNARLNMAQNAWLSGKATAASAMASLEKMIKEPANRDYLDQIYYALASIALQNKDRAAAITYLSKAARNTKGNNFQLSETYYTLAQLHLETEDFVPAKNYLDSCLNVMDKNDERYRPSDKLRNSLSEIAKNLEIIALQDSMLKLAALSDADLKKLAEKIKKQRDDKRLADLANTKANPTAGNTPGASLGRTPLLTKPIMGPNNVPIETFFAYDDKRLRQGKREFDRLWGSRALQDDWRRASRSAPRASNENDNTPKSNNPDAPKEEQSDEIATYLGPVPRTEADMQSAQTRLIEAMFKLGAAYHDQLENYPKTVEALERLNQRFARHNYDINSWYYLYLAYKKMNQNSQAQVYFDKIVKGYPTSTFAKVLTDPNYVKELANEEFQVNKYYDDAYSTFRSGKAQDALKMCTDSKVRFGAENPLASRFALLSAFCTGKIQGVDAYKFALNEVISRYPNTDEERRAKEVLRLLGGASANLPGDGERSDPESGDRFKLDDDAIHFIMLVLDNKANQEEIKAKISDYNQQFHSLQKISISSLFLGDDEATQKLVIILRRFENRKPAMDYYSGVQKNHNAFIPSGTNYEIYPINMSNYREILRYKTTDGYREFFEAKYKQ